ncbi:hypothetical protein [Mixta hanseatica]|uniref:KAP NTPase domain-containing protein n=1 Tax=Mixta hanseatica TaxID=2872648 RepID=A0ABY4RA99_9GAMM|nr:hypothetical protein [Mixta hanseatica]UQY43294.1 hypothetical protein K6958_15570 [Mixta hanseatica]
MSTMVIEEQIRNFLKSDSPDVMAIKGAWGIGKTYSWNRFLNKAKEDNAIKLNKYCYVSLFGINNLETLKYSLFENTIPIKMIGREPSLSTLKENTASVLSGYGKLAGGIFKNTPLAKNVTPVLESLAFINFRETIVCIDDLERKGKNLDLKDVMGLVSLLKEHKKCKVVLLLNDGTQETHEFNTYKEKVLDIDLTFNPSPSESAKIAYDGSGKYHHIFTEYTERLGIINIRVLKKIEKSVNSIEHFFEKTHPSLIKDAINSVVLFTWCYYSFNNDELVPPLEFIASNEFYLYGFINKEEKDPKKLAWKKVISEYGYKTTDNVDEGLLNLVKHGYVITESFELAVKEKNDKVLTGLSKDAFFQAWSLYHDSFENNESEVVDGLMQSFESNYRNISPGNLDGLIELMRCLNRNNEASILIKKYIEGRKDERELFNIHSRELIRALKDGELIDAFNDFYSSSPKVKTESLLDILIRLSQTNGWSDKDIEILSKASIEDFYSTFKASKGQGVHGVVEAALQFGKFGGADNRHEIIAYKAKWALTIISYESAINKLRVEKFDVDLE